MRCEEILWDAWEHNICVGDGWLWSRRWGSLCVPKSVVGKYSIRGNTLCVQRLLTCSVPAHRPRGATVLQRPDGRGRGEGWRGAWQDESGELREQLWAARRGVRRAYGRGGAERAALETALRLQVGPPIADPSTCVP